VRAGRLYAGKFRRWPEARAAFEKAARAYQGREPWASSARAALLDCPDYFPLRQGAEPVFVDSLTGGRNMRLALRVQASTDGVRGSIDGAYYAGSQRVRETHLQYAKEDWAVWEINGKERVPILRYPFKTGMQWTSRRDGRPIEFRIESDTETVTLKGRKFYDCLKVRESAPNAQAWTNVYYAPGIGRIKTTIGVPGSETPNTELAPS
jgi:hypothetical protein